MNEPSPASTGGLGGEGKVVEIDETYVGGKGNNRAHRKPSPKKAVVSLIERDGRVASFQVANVTAQTVRPIIVKHVSRKSMLMTDESNVYTKLGREFASHHAVDHSRDEYAYFDKPTGRTVSINISENFYSIFKRRDHGRLSLDQRGALAPLFDGVRFPVQQSLKTWRRGRRARGQSA
jgi:transposase-like protein